MAEDNDAFSGGLAAGDVLHIWRDGSRHYHAPGADCVVCDDLERSRRSVAEFKRKLADYTSTEMGRSNPTPEGDTP